MFALTNNTPSLLFQMKFNCWSFRAESIWSERYHYLFCQLLAVLPWCVSVTFDFPNFGTFSVCRKSVYFYQLSTHFTKSGQSRHHYPHNWDNSSAMFVDACCQLAFFPSFYLFSSLTQKVNFISKGLLLAFSSSVSCYLICTTFIFDIFYGCVKLTCRNIFLWPVFLGNY